MIISLAFGFVTVFFVFLLPIYSVKNNRNTIINTHKNTSFLLRMLYPLLFLLRPIIQKALSNTLKNGISKKLVHAGLSFTISATDFYSLKIISLFFSLICYFIMQWNFSISFSYFYFSIISVIGFNYPNIWLGDKIKIRKNKISKHFPFLLDLIVLTMRAGLPFIGAVNHSISKLNDGPLVQELLWFSRETKTGLSRHDALERLSDRIDLPAVTNFVATIIQAEETGGNITNALIEQSKQRRKERFLLAEKKANEAPVKMLIPLIGLLFPITFIIIAFPIAIQFIESGLLESIIK